MRLNRIPHTLKKTIPVLLRFGRSQCILKVCKMTVMTSFTRVSKPKENFTQNQNNISESVW
jgi:hypothetical protein